MHHSTLTCSGAWCRRGKTGYCRGGIGKEEAGFHSIHWLPQMWKDNQTHAWKLASSRMEAIGVLCMRLFPDATCPHLKMHPFLSIFAFHLHHTGIFHIFFLNRCCISEVSHCSAEKKKLSQSMFFFFQIKGIIVRYDHICCITVYNPRCKQIVSHKIKHF